MSQHENKRSSIEACNTQKAKKLPLGINQSNYTIHEDGDVLSVAKNKVGYIQKNPLLLTDVAVNTENNMYPH
jgi:hypothetical protein